MTDEELANYSFEEIAKRLNPDNLRFKDKKLESLVASFCNAVKQELKEMKKNAKAKGFLKDKKKDKYGICLGNLKAFKNAFSGYNPNTKSQQRKEADKRYERLYKKLFIKQEVSHINGGETSDQPTEIEKNVGYINMDYNLIKDAYNGFISKIKKVNIDQNDKSFESGHDVAKAPTKSPNYRSDPSWDIPQEVEEMRRNGIKIVPGTKEPIKAKLARSYFSSEAFDIVGEKEQTMAQDAVANSENYLTNIELVDEAQMTEPKEEISEYVEDEDYVIPDEADEIKRRKGK